MNQQEELAMLKSARCTYVGRKRAFIASAHIAGKRRRVMGSTFDGAFMLLASLSLTLTGCPPTPAPVDAAETPDARDDDAHEDVDATYRDDAWADDARELADDAPIEDAPSICIREDACPPGYTWTVCGCATDCVPPACGADQ